MRRYYTYITSNPGRTTFYVGITNSLVRRMREHFESRGDRKHFASKYYCYDLVYFEIYPRPMMAIRREKQLKKWPRAKKLALILTHNPHLITLKPP